MRVRHYLEQDPSRIFLKRAHRIMLLVQAWNLAERLLSLGKQQAILEARASEDGEGFGE